MRERERKFNRAIHYKEIMLSRQVSQGPPGNWEGNVQAVIEKSETHIHTHEQPLCSRAGAELCWVPAVPCHCAGVPCLGAVSAVMPRCAQVISVFVKCL